MSVPSPSDIQQRKSRNRLSSSHHYYIKKERQRKMPFLFYIYYASFIYVMPPRCYYYAILVIIIMPPPLRYVMPSRHRSLGFYQAPLSPSLSPLSHFRAEFGSPVFCICQLSCRFPPFSPFLLIFSISAPVRLIFVKLTPKIRLFQKKKLRKIWWVQKKAVLLHSLSGKR